MVLSGVAQRNGAPLRYQRKTGSVMSRSQAVGTARLLVLCESEPWRDVAFQVANLLGAPEPDFMVGVEHTLLSLATTTGTRACLLLQPSLAAGFAAELLALTVDAADDENCFIVLISADPAWPGIPVVEIPCADSVVAAMQDGLDRRSSLAVEMTGREVRAALRSNRVLARYQPMIRLADGVPVAVEALARLRNADGGTVAANLFVPAIEDAGLAPELAEAIAAHAFADHAIVSTDLVISINLSLDVLLIPAAIERLDEQRCAAGLRAERCLIELTESRVVDDLPALGIAIARLRRLGYGVAIDDVGPDVANYRALLDLPFTTMKLAFEIVQRTADQAAARDFVSETIELGRRRGLDVVAEGIETQELWTSMQQLGAFARPGIHDLPAAARDRGADLAGGVAGSVGRPDLAIEREDLRRRRHARIVGGTAGRQRLFGHHRQPVLPRCRIDAKRPQRRHVQGAVQLRQAERQPLRRHHVRIRPGGEADAPGRLGIARLRRAQAEARDRRQQHRVGHSMRHMEMRPDRPRHAMHQRDRCVGERKIRLRGAEHHRGARRGVGGIVMHGAQIAADQFHGGQCQRVGHRVGAARDVSLQRVRQRVDPGIGGQSPEPTSLPASRSPRALPYPPSRAAREWRPPYRCWRRRREPQALRRRDALLPHKFDTLSRRRRNFLLMTKTLCLPQRSMSPHRPYSTRTKPIHRHQEYPPALTARLHCWHIPDYHRMP